MEQSVKQQLTYGVVWNFVEKVLMRGATFLIGIILARLLEPSDFGLIGMLTIFVATSSIFIEGGLAYALVQRHTCENIDYSTAFVSNIFVAFLIYIILFISAPWIAAFYQEPILVNLTRVLSLNFILGSFNIVQRAKLMSNVDFKSLAKINVSSTIISGIVGISMAYCGFGVWSLVGQTLSSTLVLFILFPLFSRWRPSIKFSKQSFKRLFGYGSKLMFTGIVSVIMNNLSTIFIGRYYRSQQLGVYTRSLQFSDFLATIVSEVMGTVSFPVISGVQNDKEKVLKIYKKTLLYTATLVIPLMVLLALLAKPLVLVLLTEKWLDCVVLMQWLFLARIVYPLSSIHGNLLNAMGRSDLFMKVDFSKIPMNLLMLAITIPIGVKAITIGMLITAYIAFFINAYFPGKMLGYGAIQQLTDWRYIILSMLIMALAVWIFVHVVSNVWLQLIGGGFIGVIVYVTCCLFFRVFDDELLSLIRQKRV